MSESDDWISWLPPWLPSEEVACFEIPASGEARWRCARPTADGWSLLGKGLRAARQDLSRLPIADIVAALDRVAARWGERTYEPRVRARGAVVASTGFSPEAVDRSFDVELRNYRADSLLRVLRRELGVPDVLDAFTPDGELKGHARAIGPTITLAILTGNVPGLPALSIVRSLLVKSAIIAKVASGEPTFAAAFVQTIGEVEPKLANAIAVTYWDRDDQASLDAALAQVDAVIAYGGENACAAVRKRVEPHQRYIEHGHKVSVEIVGRSYLDEVGDAEVARRVATDVSTFNQHACIAPQAVLVEADVERARAFGAELARAMDAYASDCPLGILDEQDASSLQLRRATEAWAAAADGERDLWTGARLDALDWTVVLGPDLGGITGAGNRVVRVVPVASLEAALGALAPIGRYLQNVGLGARKGEFWPTAEHLARCGASRISEPGRMAEPSMMWRHDGMACVAALVRFCDVEMRAEPQDGRVG